MLATDKKAASPARPRAAPARTAHDRRPQPRVAGTEPLWLGLERLGGAGGVLARQARVEPRRGYFESPAPRVSRPEDPSEREAERAADSVMRSEAPVRVTPLGPVPAVARSCSACQREEDQRYFRAALPVARAPRVDAPRVQRSCARCEDEAPTPADAGASPIQAPSEFPARLASLGGGEPLPAAERAFFEPRFERSFAGVRLHSGARAAALADAVAARAFTVGRSIVLGAGEHAPGTAAARRLLAHELTHVVQQGAADAGPARVQRQEKSSPPAPAPAAGAADEEPSCESATRGLGDVTPSPGCDPAKTDLDEKHIQGGPHLYAFYFCLDSDVFSGTRTSEVATFARAQAAGARFIIHAFSSSEGAADYNQRLSCHRALRVARELRNAGVPPIQIVEASGLGATTMFGEPELNRVAIVKAEGGEVSDIEETPRPATTTDPEAILAHKIAVVDAARARLLAKQYRLDADAYLSYWTCGHVPSIASIVARLNILIEDEPGSAVNANGTPEALGNGTIRVSARSLATSNPIECAMACIVDMAFHQAVMGDASLSADLQSLDARHAAGRHLAYRAGLGACVGRTAKTIDPPLEGDPREMLSPPPCAETPQPTRAPPPRAGDRQRKEPQFRFDVHFDSSQGDVSSGLSEDPSVSTRGDVLISFLRSAPMIRADATGELVGDPKTFADYELGFVQTVLEDSMTAEYASGDSVVQELPVPIRDADMQGSATAAAPWIANTAHAHPSADGKVTVSAAPRSSLPARAALLYEQFDSQQKTGKNLIDSFQRRTRLGIWLIARRLDAPLDRFSTHFIQGHSFDLAQSATIFIRRAVDPTQGTGLAGEKEMYGASGTFAASAQATSPDSRLAQLGGPASGDIDLARQLTQLNAAEPATEEDGMTLQEYQAAIAEILDGLELYPSAKEAAVPKNAAAMPRLGYVFSPLDIGVTVNARSGRVAIDDPSVDQPVKMRSPALSRSALDALASALENRLRKRDSPSGKKLALRPSAIPKGTRPPLVVVKLPPLMEEPDLSKNPMVLLHMAQMWACTEESRRSPDTVSALEFGAAYYVTRAGLVRPVLGQLESSTEQDADGVTQINLTCGPDAIGEGTPIGTVHTHPEDSGQPSDADAALAKSARCGRAHYIVTESGVFVFRGDGVPRKLGDRKSLLPAGQKCP